MRAIIALTCSSIAILCSVILLAQTHISRTQIMPPSALLLGQQVVQPDGATVVVPLNFIPIGQQPAGLQWSFMFGTGISAISVAAGPAATAAQKTISCAGTTGRYMCLLTGINKNTIGPGAVATVTVTLATGTYSAPVILDDTLGATLAGNLDRVLGIGTVITVPPPPTPPAPQLKSAPKQKI